MIERLRDVQCVLLAKVEESLECLDRIDTKELCDVLNMIKDISKAIYYETTIQAMKDKTTPITVVTK